MEAHALGHIVQEDLGGAMAVVVHGRGNDLDDPHAPLGRLRVHHLRLLVERMGRIELLAQHARQIGQHVHERSVQQLLAADLQQLGRGRIGRQHRLLLRIADDDGAHGTVEQALELAAGFQGLGQQMARLDLARLEAQVADGGLEQADQRRLLRQGDLIGLPQGVGGHIPQGVEMVSGAGAAAAGLVPAGQPRLVRRQVGVRPGGLQVLDQCQQGGLGGVRCTGVRLRRRKGLIRDDAVAPALRDRRGVTQQEPGQLAALIAGDRQHEVIRDLLRSVGAYRVLCAHGSHSTGSSP